MKPKKPLKKPSAARSRRDNEIETQTTYGNENAASEVEVEVEAIEAITTMIDAHHETRDHHLPDAGAHEVATAALHLGAMWIPTFLVVEVAVAQMTDAAERLLQDDRLLFHDPLRGLLLDGDTKTMILHHDEDDNRTLQADLGPLHAEISAETETEEVVQDAVIIEIDP